MAGTSDKKPGRSERLAAALRENLKRRKAQAKGRAAKGAAQRADAAPAEKKEKAD